MEDYKLSGDSRKMCRRGKIVPATQQGRNIYRHNGNLGGHGTRWINGEAGGTNEGL